MKYTLLIMLLIIISPLALTVAIMIGVVNGLRDVLLDIKDTLKYPENSKLYRWMEKNND